MFDWSHMLDWVYWGLLLCVLVAGWLLNVLGLPGLWLMVLGHLIFAWVTGWNVYVGWPSVIILILLGALAEVVEFVAGAAGSAKAGGTKRGSIGAIVGGLIGGFVGTGLIPIPVVGTVIGAVAGAFLGASVVEIMIDPDTGRAWRVGVGAAKGRFAGIVIKSVFGAIMFVVSLVAALPIGRAAALAPPAPTTTSTSQPATLPATTAP
jgi:uncharacterized protein YqgC (DUF456 family)